MHESFTIAIILFYPDGCFVILNRHNTAPSVIVSCLFFVLSLKLILIIAIIAYLHDLWLLGRL
jgi:hypothetical protein